jgi:hypothetical protein
LGHDDYRRPHLRRNYIEQQHIQVLQIYIEVIRQHLEWLFLRSIRQYLCVGRLQIL